MNSSDQRHLRNVAIIAHVDHGKTTLVDAMLEQAGAIARGTNNTECILDSNPLERERGITIFSKNCAVTYKPSEGSLKGEEVRINIIDTPGHADFGGEVERVLSMADGVLLLVDAFEGPMPQTRFVLTKALMLELPIIVVVNKCDRPDARPDEVVNEVFDLLVAMGADDETLDFPVVFASGRSGWASMDHHEHGNTIAPLLDLLVERIPAPSDDIEAPLQMLVTTLDYSSYVGRIAIGRVYGGTIRTGQPVVVCGKDGKLTKSRAQKVYRFEGLGRTAVDEVCAGDLCAIEGLSGFDIGDTVADQEYPIALPRVAVDEPTLHMIFRINDSPLAGKEGKYVTSRQIAERLDQELQSNVALRVEPGESAEEFNVSGRGLLHLGVLLENMRREGFELAVGRPEVIIKEIDGVMCEPIERLTLDLDSNTMGPAIELLGVRGGEVISMDHRGERMHIECDMPAQGLIGLRSRMLTATGGEAVMYHSFLRYDPIKTVDRTRSNGVMIATESGTATTYSLLNLCERGVMFVQNTDPVYQGMIVGENSRDNDLGVNPAKAKAFSNVREANKEAFVGLKAPRLFSLEVALEYIQSDELVEITPSSIRLRKRLLCENARKRIDRAKKARLANV